MTVPSMWIFMIYFAGVFPTSGKRNQGLEVALEWLETQTTSR